jgi:hypothetical protein
MRVWWVYQKEGGSFLGDVSRTILWTPSYLDSHLVLEYLFIGIVITDLRIGCV